MKTLFINRHAKSSWNKPALTDFERPLNKRGKVNAEYMAARFAGEERADLLLSSPAIRARCTAEYFRRALKLPEERMILAPKIYEAGVGDLLHLINRLDDRYSSVLIFGHNPSLSSLASYLDHSFYDTLVTCARVRIDFELDSWAEVSGGLGSTAYHVYPRIYPEMSHL